MLIISKFHDYYDRATSHGVDKSIVFKREQKTLEDNRKPFSSNSGFSGSPNYIDWENFWIGFCGRWYFGRMESRTVKEGFYSKRETKFYYGQEAADRAYPDGKSTYSIFRNSNRRAEIMNNHGKSRNLEVFIDLNSPTLAIYKDQLIVNPALSEFQFQKVVSPYDAFQSIEMFLTNELARQVDPPPLDDKGRAVAHGFDKWSFRRDTPPKRKQKK